MMKYSFPRYLYCPYRVSLEDFTCWFVTFWGIKKQRSKTWAGMQRAFSWGPWRWGHHRSSGSEAGANSINFWLEMLHPWGVAPSWRHSSCPEAHVPSTEAHKETWLGSLQSNTDRVGGISWWYTKKPTGWGRREDFSSFIPKDQTSPHPKAEVSAGAGMLCSAPCSRRCIHSGMWSDIHLDLMPRAIGILSSTWTRSKGDDCALQPSERCPKNTALSCPPVSKINPRGFSCYTTIRVSKSICCLQHISFPSLSPFHCAHCVCPAPAAAAQSKIKPSADKLGFIHEKKTQKTPEKRDNQAFFSCLKWT